MTKDELDEAIKNSETIVDKRAREFFIKNKFLLGSAVESKNQDSIPVETKTEDKGSEIKPTPLKPAAVIDGWRKGKFSEFKPAAEDEELAAFLEDGKYVINKNYLGKDGHVYWLHTTPNGNKYIHRVKREP